MNPKDVVREGYDKLSLLYRKDDDRPEHYGRWVDDLAALLPAGGSVLDIGCGCGVPVVKSLVKKGLEATGVDISPVQIERARALVPGAQFICGDASDLRFAAGSLDAVVSLYAFIHLPHGDQQVLLKRIAEWLKPGGRFLVTTGVHAWTGSEEGWLGGDARMWWSHPELEVFRGWLTDAGFTISSEEFVPEGEGGHQLLWCQAASAYR